MKEIGILMQPEMVRANLQDLKTETRRTRGLKEINADIAAYEREEEPAPFTWELEGAHIDPLLLPIGNNKGKKAIQGDGFYATFRWTGKGDIWRSIKCPYGKPGDLLWVRETWSEPQLHDGFEPDFVFRADGEYGRWGNCGWHPSIHMPKKAARIWLRVKEINIERLHEITWQACKAEGIKPKLINPGSMFNSISYSEGYKGLWIEINGEESWNQNPYVWVVKYEVLSKNGKPELCNDKK